MVVVPALSPRAAPSTARSSGRCTSTSARYDWTAGASPTSRPACSDSSHLCSMTWREELRRLQLAAQVRRHRPDHRLEDLGQPAVRGELLVGQVALGPVGVEVVEQPPGLVLLGVQPGQPQQPAGVVAGVDDLRPHQVRPARRRSTDIATSATSKPSSLSRRMRFSMSCRASRLDLLLVRDLVPQPLVAGDHLVGDHAPGRSTSCSRPAGLQVERLAEDVQPGDLEVLAALAVGQRAGAARRSRRRPGTPRTRPRRAGTACWTASSRPRRSRSGASGRSARRARRAAGSWSPAAACARTAPGTAARTAGAG